MKPKETDLTDYLAGEMKAARHRAFEQELAGDANLREECEGHRATSQEVSAALQADMPCFSPGELASLRQKMGLPAVEAASDAVSFPRRFARVAGWSALAAACIAAMVYLLNGFGSSTGEVDRGASNVAGREEPKLYQPQVLVANPGEPLSEATAAEAKPRILENAWAAKAHFAALRSPDLVRIDRQSFLRLPAVAGASSLDEIRRAVLEEQRLPRGHEVRLLELGAAFGTSGSEPGLSLYRHPWDQSLLLVKVKTGPDIDHAKVELEGSGSIRLFGEQVLPSGDGKAVPFVGGLKRPTARQWWLEGDLSGLSLRLVSEGGRQLAQLQAGSTPTALAEAPLADRTSMLLLGLGEFLRGSDAAPRPSELLAECEVLRTAPGPSRERDEVVKLIEATMLLKQRDD